MFDARTSRGALARRFAGLVGTVLGLTTTINGCAASQCCCGPDCCKPGEKSEARKQRAATDYTHTLKSDAEYYLDSPAQGRPPDGTWKAGTAVTLIAEEGSYARVKSAEGVEAHVSSAALQPR